MLKNRGFSMTILVLFIGLFLVIPVIFLAFGSETPSEEIKGVTSVSTTSLPSLVFKINSSNGTWDLYEFLCTSEDECLQDLTSGKRHKTTSGGEASGHSYYLEKTTEWGDVYSHLKVFIKSGWGSASQGFDVELVNSIENVSIQTFTYEGKEHKAVIVTLGDLVDLQGPMQIAEFFDQ